MIRNQKIKGTFICWLLFLKWMGVFQSWLDCFSARVWAFIQNINFWSSVAFVYWCPIVTIFECCSLNTLFSRASNCIRYCPNSLHLTLLRYWILIYLEDIIEIWIISSKDINLLYIYKAYCRGKGQHLMQQKKDFFGTTVY